MATTACPAKSRKPRYLWVCRTHLRQPDNLPIAQIKNAAGNYVSPTTDSVTAALASATIPDDFRFSMTNAAGAASYPISGVTWLLVYQKQENAERAIK